MATGEGIPETQFTTLGEDRIAYQVFGEGDVDLLLAPVISGSIELRWDWPVYVKVLRTLGGWARVIMFDGRGSGVSDAPSGEPLPSVERWADDVGAVDAANCERAVIFGVGDSGPTAILYAASHPTRTRGLILGNTWARRGAAPDYPCGVPTEALDQSSRFIEEVWGTEAMAEYGYPDAARHRGIPAMDRPHSTSVSAPERCGHHLSRRAVHRCSRCSGVGTLSPPWCCIAKGYRPFLPS